jgi:hypothetical protein
MAQRLSASELDDAASDANKTVLRWAESGPARADALSAVEVGIRVEKLKGDVVELWTAHTNANEFFVRYHLMMTRGWSEFAQQYPTFWAKLTSASCTRLDVITIHMMVDTRLAFEEGKIADEKEVDSIIQNNLLALSFKDKGQGSGMHPRDAQEKQLRDQARLRRKFIEKTYADVLVPVEELSRRGVKLEAGTMVRNQTIAAIIAAHEKLAESLKTPEGRNARAKALSEVPSTVGLFARRFLELRAGIAEKCGGAPDILEAKGLNFMPTYERSAQVSITFDTPVMLNFAGTTGTTGTTGTR